MVVTDYEQTIQTLLATLKANCVTIGVSEESITESNEQLDFNVPAPYIYFHTDFGKTRVQGNYIVELLIDYFIVTESSSVQAAKVEGMEIINELMPVLRETQFVKFPPDCIELFLEYSSKCVLRLKTIQEITLVSTGT